MKSQRKKIAQKNENGSWVSMSHFVSLSSGLYQGKDPDD